MGGSTIRPTVDAIQEFEVQRNAFTAEEGWGTTVVNTVLRTGTNSLHGSAYEFLRNNVLDSRNFFDVNTPHFTQNQFGATVGGPILKNKAYFFGSYEGFRQDLTNTLLAMCRPRPSCKAYFRLRLRTRRRACLFPTIRSLVAVLTL